MKKAIDEDEMPPEIDFPKAVQGKFAERFARGSNIVVIRPELFAAFPAKRL